MNLTFEELKCPKCRMQTMEPNGSNHGGRITSVQQKCTECGFTLLMIPIKKDLEYQIKATTEQERKDERIKKAKEESELELAKRITQIQETEY